jgi:AcrR family transcriptional regulator
VAAVPKIKAKSPSTRRRNTYEKRMASILEAAAKVIARNGFDGASVRDVAAQGNVGLSGIYYYFKSKDEVLYAIQHHAFSTLVKRLRERMDESVTPEDKLKAVIDNHFDFFVNHTDEFRVCIHEIDSLSGKYYKGVLETRREYFHLVRGAVAEACGGTKDDIDQATLSLFGSLNWVYMWYDPRRNADVEAMSSRFLQIFLNGINAL